MKLTEEIKNLIIKENEEFRAQQYGGLTKEERKKLGAFYTPGPVVIQMIEHFDTESMDKSILDPTCGSGNLLAGCIIAGANSQNVYGNEFDPSMVELCRKRLNNVCDMLGKPHIRDWQIHCGNALDPTAISDFSPEYEQKQQEELIIYGVRYTGFKASEEFKNEYKGKKLQAAMKKYGLTN